MKRGTKNLLSKFKLGKSYNLISMPTITLTEEEADRFIDYIVDESVMKDYARIVRMKQPQKNIRAIGFGSGKFLYPAQEFNESKYKKQWAHNRIQLNVKKARGAVAVFDDDLEDIRGVTTEAKFIDQLMRLIAQKISHELEEAYWIGDTAGLNGFQADDIRGMWDGWRYIINHSAQGETYYNQVTGSSHLKDACACESGAGCQSGNWDPSAEFRFAGGIAERSEAAPYDWEFKYHMMLKNMPSKYKQKNALANLKFLNSDLVTQDYIEALSTRGTALGDSIFTGAMPAAYGKVQILDVPLMATDLGQDTDGTYGLVGGGGYTDVVLTHKGNFIIGIQREIKIETQRVPADEATYVFYSLKTDVKIENVDAVVLTRCMTHRC
jgi:hypothetical protein